MGAPIVREWAGGLWELANRQHGVVSRAQLAALGMSDGAIRHRLANGRLHRLMPGVYAIGRRQVGKRGRWMAAVLACGPQALLSHRSAAALWRIRKPGPGQVEVVVPASVCRRPSDIRVYRRLETHSLVGSPVSPPDLAGGEGTGGGGASLWRKVGEIPVTAPAIVLVDLASCLPTGQVEAAVIEADQLGLIDPEELRAFLDLLARRPGLVRLRRLLDAATATLTTTELERRFLPLVARAGLPPPTTQRQLGKHRVDFLWPELELVVETDSLRYHRTAFRQASDKRRDNANARLGLATLRFSHGQVRYEPGYVLGELRGIARVRRAKREGSLSL